MSSYFEFFGSMTISLVGILMLIGLAVATVFSVTRSWGWRLLWVLTVTLGVSAALLVSQGVSARDGLYVVLAQLGAAMLALLSVAAASAGAFVGASRFSSSRPASVVASVAGAVLSAPLFLLVPFGVACSLGECS